jgi:hypothetical protein
MMRCLTFALALLAIGSLEASAQGDPPKRRFDLTSGIVFTCSPATGIAWTGKACDELTSEFRKRAELAGLKFTNVLITADFKTKRFPVAGGFDQDKAIRVFWFMHAPSGPDGTMSAKLMSNVVFEPTPAEIPNVVPGQRIPINFYTQSVTLDAGARHSDAQPYLKQITDAFFKSGEMAVQK